MNATANDEQSMENKDPIPPFTLTIHIAEAGTPIMEETYEGSGNWVWKGKTSKPGHMWYSINDGNNKPLSYGFEPEDGKNGPRSVVGKVTTTDRDAYHQPLYERTIEISEEQYDELVKFGKAGVEKGYHSLTNSCVDFTWNALKQAGFNWHVPEQTVRVQGANPNQEKYKTIPAHDESIPSNFEGVLIPSHNRSWVDRIIAPNPDSSRNKTTRNKLTAKKAEAKLLEERADEFKVKPKETLEKFKEYEPLHAANKTLEAVKKHYPDSPEIVKKVHHYLAGRLKRGAPILLRRDASIPPQLASEINKEVSAELLKERVKAFRENKDNLKEALKQFPGYDPLHKAYKTLEAVKQRYPDSPEIVTKMHGDLANQLEHGKSIPTPEQAFKEIDKEVPTGLLQKKAEASSEKPKAVLKELECDPFHAANETLEAISQRFSGSQRGNAIVARMDRYLANQLERGASIPTPQQAFKYIANAMSRGHGLG